MSKEDMDLFEQFIRLEWLLHRYHQQNHRDHGPMGDPHRGQGRVLALLKLKPEMSQKELSDILDIRSQSLGELLAKLERSGYITRTPSQADRRIMDIHLTEEGKAASEKDEQQESGTLFACLNEEEQATLRDYLSRIIKALEQQYGDSEARPDFRDRPDFDARGFGRLRGDAPPFDGRGFDRRSGMGDRRPPFDGRGIGGHPGMEPPRPPFHGNGFGRQPGEGDKPDDSDQE